MRAARILPFALAAAALVAGCAEEPTVDKGGGGSLEVEHGTNDEGYVEPFEFAYLSFDRKGDRTAERARKTIYLLLYTKGWMQTDTFGGPFEAIAKKEGVYTSWKEIKKRACQDLYAYFYERGFFELPGSSSVDWTRFKQDGYSTKAISVNRQGERHVVFFEDVTGKEGNDPNWNVFNDCEKQLLTVFSAIEDVRPVVQKAGFQQALDDYLRWKNK